MVLHPISSGDPDASSRQSNSGSAWEVVEKQQKENAQEWWLIAQPDHAALAGDLAALLDAPSVPDLDEPLLRAISLHDSGWAQFDGGERGTGRELEVSLRDPKTDAEGKPLSFLEMSVEEFLLAWETSIANAADASPAGGAVVSEHFCRLTRTRLQSHSDAAQERGRLHDFLTRQRDLQALCCRGMGVLLMKLQSSPTFYNSVTCCRCICAAARQSGSHSRKALAVNRSAFLAKMVCISWNPRYWAMVAA